MVTGLELNEQDNSIISSLLKEGAVTEKQLDEISKNHLLSLENKKKELFNKVYLFDLNKRVINILDKNLKESSIISLKSSHKSNFNPDEWQTWGKYTIGLSSENKKEAEIEQTVESTYGLGFIGTKAYLYKPGFEEELNLIQLRTFIYGATPKSKMDSLPFDIFFSDDYSLMFVSERAAGNIYIIDLKQDKLIRQIEIKAPANNNTINIAHSMKKNKLYISDYQATALTIIDLNSFETEVKNLGIGVLGNISVSPDQESLYCIVTKPKQILKLISLDDFSLKKDFPLKGELYSTGDVPFDFLAYSEDKSSVFILTYIMEPEPFTPVITVIDAEKEKAVQRFSIKDGSGIPINIGKVEENPAYFSRKTILELAIENNLTNQEQISEIKKSLNEQALFEQIKESTDFESGGQKQQMQQQSISASGSSAPVSNKNKAAQNEKKKEDSIWKIEDKPQKIDFCNISPGLDEVLLKKCREQINMEYEKILKVIGEKEGWKDMEGEIELRFLTMENSLDKEKSMLSMRLNDAIVKARQELEWHNLSIIRLKDLLEGYNFEIKFGREECLEWLREKERDELVQKGMKTIATNCPNCNAQLLGSYTCRSCGFELEKPEDAIRKKLLQIATFEPLEYLKHGHLMILDVINHKIMEINHFRKIVWEVKKDVLHSEVSVEFKIPRDAIRLKNKITLIVDYELNRVFKLTEKGRIFWEFNTEMYPDNKLNHPISASALENGNIIIVDQGNHRVIEVNEEHEIVWKYGQKGVQGIDFNMLNTPAFFQRTGGATNIIVDSGNHRVIEMEGDQIIWQFGNEENLEGDDGFGDGPGKMKFPTSCWRTDKGNTVILDSGNQRVIEVNHEKEIIWEYRTNEGYEGYQIENPVKAYVLRTGKILVVGEEKVIEIDREDKEVTWSCTIDQLERDKDQQDIRTVQENVKKTKVRHGVSNPYARRAGAETDEERERKEKIRKYMEEKRSQLSNRNPASISRSPVMLSPGAKVSAMEIYLLDKNKGSIFKINRKGELVWEYNNQNELSKPENIYINEPDSIYVADSENKRIVELDLKTKEIIWSLDNFNSPEKMNYPKSIEITEEGNILVADQLGAKVFEINKKGNTGIIWDYKGIDVLKAPYYASRLKNGNTLIVDWSAHSVIEVNKEKEVVWSYGSGKPGNEDNHLSYPEYAIRLVNNNTLIADTRNSRVIEVNPGKQIVWSYEGKGTSRLMGPLFARRLDDGNTLIVHSNSKQIMEVSSQGEPLWKYNHQR